MRKKNLNKESSINKLSNQSRRHRKARPIPITLPEGVPQFTHINQNDSSGRKRIKQEEEDIHICACKYNCNDPHSACGERCLNVLTSIECVPGYCPCSENCKNQRFQKCEFAKTKLFKTEGRGWGLLADETIKAGQFILEYCGEIISSEEARHRFLNYEAQGLRDLYIISLNANYFIDATNKGSLARFINHSCNPNCETRKWKVLGETRVGIFAKQDISVGTELAYDYKFECYGSANVRCLCGAPNCSKFLGAKSRGFQEHNHVWEEGDARYRVDEIPTYDSSEDEPSSKLSRITISSNLESKASGSNDKSVIKNNSVVPEHPFEFTTVKTEQSKETKSSKKDTKLSTKVKAMSSSFQSNSGSLNFNAGSGTFSTKGSSAQQNPNRRPKYPSRRKVNRKHAAKLFSSKKVQEEILKYEEIKDEATTKLNAVYDEIRPAIEEHERDDQDSVSTSLAEKWIEASCTKMSASFDFYLSIIQSTVCPEKESGYTKRSAGSGNGNAGK